MPAACFLIAFGRTEQRPLLHRPRSLWIPNRIDFYSDSLGIQLTSVFAIPRPPARPAGWLAGWLARTRSAAGPESDSIMFRGRPAAAQQTDRRGGGDRDRQRIDRRSIRPIQPQKSTAAAVARAPLLTSSALPSVMFWTSRREDPLLHSASSRTLSRSLLWFPRTCARGRTPRRPRTA